MTDERASWTRNGDNTASRTEGMRVHPLRTGTIRFRPHHLSARWRRRPLRYLDILTDREWTEPLPVFAWLVDHPDGLILVDTGVTTASYDTGRFDRLTREFVKRTLLVDVAPEEEVDRQLDRLGVEPEDVRWLVQTHLHVDHADGVSAFRNAEVLVSRREMEAEPSSVRASVEHTWPAWLHRRLLEYDTRLGPFPEAHPIRENVVVVATPGHTPGHQSVVLRDGDCTVFLAGDATYSQSQLVDGVVAGIVDDHDEARRTIERIRSFVRETPTVYLPSHDPDAPERLRKRETVPLAGDDHPRQVA